MAERRQRKCVSSALSFAQLLHLCEPNSAELSLPRAALASKFLDFYFWRSALKFWRVRAGIYTHIGRKYAHVVVFGACFILRS